MLLMLDAAKRASARHITAVIPYFGWARQDRKDKPRVPIGAKLIAKLIESAGATRIITMDLHADQIQGFFEKPVDHLYASAIFVPYLQSLKIDNLTIASPDMGGSKRAYAYSKFLNSDVVICYKQRSKGNIITHMELIGDVSGKNVVLIEYPRKGSWAVGFATKDNTGEIESKTKKNLVNVFVPTTPNPTSGFLLMIPKDELIFLDMTFEEASKFIVSAGTSDSKD